jgi:phage-related protein
MPETLASALVTLKNSLHNADGWRWLVEIDADGTNGYRLNDGDQPLTYAGDVYQAYPFRVEEVRAESDGSLPSVALVFASVDDEIAGQLDSGNVLDRRIRIRRVNVANLAFAIDSGDWIALDAALDASSATLYVGPYPLFDSPFPALRQLRGRCPKVYGGPDCGYDLTRSGALTSCDYSLADCQAHGADEAAAGVAVRHPRRFGGFPGIPKGQRL